MLPLLPATTLKISLSLLPDLTLAVTSGDEAKWFSFANCAQFVRIPTRATPPPKSGRTIQFEEMGPKQEAVNLFTPSIALRNIGNGVCPYA
jgi:hypothetical protein